MRLFFTFLLSLSINLLSGQVITDVSPDHAQQGDYLEITISGENTEWQQGSHILVFKQGSSTVYPIYQNTVSDTEIKGDFHFYNSHPTGYYDVKVEDGANGTEDVLEDGFLLEEGPLPEIISIVPNEAEQVTDITVTVTGSNVNFEQSSSVLSFFKDGVAIYSYSTNYPEDSILEAGFLINAAHPLGFYDAYVMSYNETLIEEDGFEVLAATIFPEITSVEPDSAFQDTQITMTIYGTDTHFDHPGISNTVKLSGDYNILHAQSVTAVDAETIEAVFNLTYYQNPGLYDVVVINNLDWILELEDGFELLAGPDQPSITKVEPDTVMQVSEVWITITGDNIDFVQGSYLLNVERNGTYIYPESQTVLNDSMMKGDFFFNPDQPAGDYNVQLDGSPAWLENGLYVLAAEEVPVILDVSPDSAIQEEASTFVLSAENTHFNDPGIENKIYLYDGSSVYYVGDYSVISDDSITFDYTFHAYHSLGMYDVKVMNELDGTMVLDNAIFLLPAGDTPFISDVNPDYADRGESLWVTISGENTYFTLGSATIKFVQGSSTIYPNSQNIWSDTEIEGDFNLDLTHPVGFYDVVVYDINGEWSVYKEEGFYIYEETAIGEFTLGSPGSIYPNPASEKLVIERAAHTKMGMAIDILNMSGKTVVLTEMRASEQIIEIDLSDFEKGIYLVKLRCGDNTAMKKLVVR